MIQLHDPHLGLIMIKPDKRAKNVIARKKTGYFLFTVPYGFSRDNLARAIEALKPKLVKLEKPKPLAITEETQLGAFSFSVRIKRFNLAKSYRMTLKNEILTIFVPQETDILSVAAQSVIKQLIEQALRFEAKRILTQKTAFFAQKFGLDYQQVKINKSRTRWGSCSRKKSINYSLYLLLLDEKHIDYVVLHELAHTVEMNHGPRFWQLLSKFCGEDAKALSHALKKPQSESYAYFAEK